MKDNEKKRKSKIKLSTFRRILPFFRGNYRVLIIATLIVIISTLIGASLPIVMRKLIDEAIPSQDFNNVLNIGFVYLALILIHGGLNLVQGVMVGFMGIEIVNRIKNTVLEHILTLSIRFFDDNPSGKLISRIESDSQKLYMLFSSIGLQLMGAILNIIIAFIVMLTVNMELTLIVLTITPVYSILSYFFFKKMRPLYRKERALYANIYEFLGEHLKAIPLLRNLNNMRWSEEKLYNVNEEFRVFGLKLYLYQQIFWSVLMLGPHFAITLILYKSVGWISSGIITIGTIWMFIQYIHMAIRPLMIISEQLGEVQRAFSAADRIFDLIDLKPEIQNSPDAEELIEFSDEIRFEHVTFYYEPDKPVLKDISFSIKKGSTVAIVGATGSGKTTIISLLSRFYDPVEGKITIDDKELRSITQESLRSKMSLVLQDIFLFPGNLMDNLRVLRDDIPDEQVIKATTDMGINNHILNKFPHGYQTIISEEGGNLSFGERQLLSFSRALTFNPEILIMDEATSSVDPHTEAEIQKDLDILLKDRTAIVIAHRLSTIQHADKIIVIQNGQIIEEGTHDELIEYNGVYSDLYHTQMGTNN